LIVLLIGAAWLFFGILEDVVSSDPLVLADSAIFRALQDLRSAPGDAVMIAITELGDTAVVVAVTAIVFLWIVWKRACTRPPIGSLPSPAHLRSTRRSK